MSDEINPFTGGALGLVTLAVLVFDTIAIYEVLNSGRDVPSKCVWILFILMFPVLGLFVYFAFANRTHATYSSIV
jgi:hypothetical protein